MRTFDEHEFRSRIEAARRQIRTILDNTRNPQAPADVPHRYDDKYLLAEVATRTAIASLVQCLEVLGLTGEQLAQLQTWAKTRSVTLRLVAQEDCRFLREVSRKVESAEERVTETRGLLGGKTTKTEKVVTTIVEYFWAFEFDYKLVAFQGTAIEQAITLHARSGNIEIKTPTNSSPRPEVVARPPIDTNVTWLLVHLDGESRATFSISRTHAECHTPRRNRDVDAALAHFDELASWCGRVRAYFLNELFPAQQDHGLDLSAIHHDDVFVPVQPLFERDQLAGEGPLPIAYANAFLVEEQRSLTEKCRSLATVFPRDSSVITAVEAGLIVTLMHAWQTCQQHADVVAYIEDMLREQLIAAIGKELAPADFTAYMEFHHRRLVKPEFHALPFSYAIRRPEHDPEGVLSIEAGDAISTTVRRTEAQRPMSFALDASTRVQFFGERYLHAWIAHQFSGQPGPSPSLIARARQFSSFVLLVGRIAPADTFEPKIGIIIQNKDVLKIPLMLEQIPTPKAFRDAIESLSPEQQRFAKAFRGMQLESTLFGVCVIQIKPQLEKLLKLPPDSLTKEIKLTQELLDLFIEYQIPSDLLSYDGAAEASTDEKLSRVKQYIARMYEMIELSKARELEEERQREAMRLAELDLTPAQPAYEPDAMWLELNDLAGGPPGAAGFGASAPRAQAPTNMPPPSKSAAIVEPIPAVKVPDRASAMPPQGSGGDVVDYTRLPGELDHKFESLDVDGALRATIIDPGDPWQRTSQKGLLGGTTTATLAADEQQTQKNRAFDLLDALTKSGAIAIDDASLHVVLAATHCFDKTLLDTVIQDNVNPIEKVERSLLIVGTTIHGRTAAEMLAGDQRDRFFTTSPQLQLDAGD